jgi:SNF2 family DNA or RNA helicase
MLQSKQVHIRYVYLKSQVDFNMAVVGPYELYPHQIAAVQWMAEREEDDEVRGGFLCDDMGLGKTITTVAFLHQHPVETTLILCPLAVVHQWVRSIRRLAS